MHRRGVAPPIAIARQPSGFGRAPPLGRSPGDTFSATHPRLLELTMSLHPTRREFIADTTKVALGAMVLPRHLLGGPGYRAPSATLNIAVVGAGGMGMSNMSQLLSENIVALCDVDFPFVER